MKSRPRMVAKLNLLPLYSLPSHCERAQLEADACQPARQSSNPSRARALKWQRLRESHAARQNAATTAGQRRLCAHVRCLCRGRRGPCAPAWHPPPRDDQSALPRCPPRPYPSRKTTPSRSRPRGGGQARASHAPPTSRRGQRQPRLPDSSFVRSGRQCAPAALGGAPQPQQPHCMHPSVRMQAIARAYTSPAAPRCVECAPPKPHVSSRLVSSLPPARAHPARCCGRMYACMHTRLIALCLARSLGCAAHGCATPPRQTPRTFLAPPLARTAALRARAAACCPATRAGVARRAADIAMGRAADAAARAAGSGACTPLMTNLEQSSWLGRGRRECPAKPEAPVAPWHARRAGQGEGGGSFRVDATFALV